MHPNSLSIPARVYNFYSLLSFTCLVPEKNDVSWILMLFKSTGESVGSSTINVVIWQNLRLSYKRKSVSTLEDNPRGCNPP